MMTPDERRLVQDVLETALPDAASADEDVATWLATARGALRALDPTRTTDPDHMEAVDILRSLEHVCKDVGVVWDRNKPTLREVVGRWRQARDPHAARLARTVFAYLCVGEMARDARR